MKQNIDFDLLTRLFIKSLRGAQTQEGLSHDLQSNFNIVNRWETDQRGFYWQDFLSLAELKSLDLATPLKNVTHFDFSKRPEASEVLHLLLQPSSKDLLKNHFSAQKMNRLAGGKSKLLFSEFLIMIDIIYGRAERFLFQLLKDLDMSELDGLFAHKNKYREMLAQDPLLSMLRMAMGLEAYTKLARHSDELLAKLLNAPLEKITEGLMILKELGVIVQKGDTYQAVSGYVDTGAQSKVNSRKVANYWRQQIMQATSNPEVETQGFLTANLLYASNPQLEEKVFEVCRKAYIDIKNLIMADETDAKDSIRYITIELFKAGPQNDVSK